MDTVDGAKRSWIMSRVRAKDTTPERRVRSLAHRLGYRFRLHRRSLPGCPDLVFPSRKIALFVHGCFWHGHACARGDRLPSTNVEYWKNKIARNKVRHDRHADDLRELGWRVLVIWECETKDTEALRSRLDAALRHP